MIFDKPRDRLPLDQMWKGQPEPASGLWEELSANFDAGHKAWKANAEEWLNEQEFDLASDGLFALTGNRLLNPYRIGGFAEDTTPEAIMRRTGQDPVLTFEQSILDLAEQNPDKANDIRAFSGVLQRAIAKRNASARRAEDATARSAFSVDLPILGKTSPVALVGQMAAQLTDPFSLAINTIGSAGKGFSLGYHFIRAALINAGAEAVQQPFIKEWANKAGDPYGWDDAARGVLAAGLAGGVLDTAVRGGYRGVQRARGLEPERAAGTGEIVGWRSPAEKAQALDDAAAHLPEENVIRRAADGDVRAQRELAEQTGLLNDPAVRGALAEGEDALAIAEDLAGLEAGTLRRQELFLQALRSATDPDEPPPAVLASLNREGLDMSQEARLARAREMGFDTERVWYHGSPNGDLPEILPGVREPGAWFTTDLMNASQYARGHDAGVYSVFLNAKNPMVVEFAEGADGQLSPFIGGIEHPGLDNVDLVKLAMRRGHDGVHFPYGNHSEVDNTMVVFDGSQVRDTTAAFDPADASSPRLLASLPREQRRAAAAETLARTDQTAAHAAILGVRAEERLAPAGRLDDVAGAEAKAQTAALERDLSASIERARKPEVLQKRARALAGDAGDVSRAVADLAIAEGRYVHAHAATERMAEIRAEIDRTVKMLPKDVRLRVVDTLRFGEREANGAWDGYDRIVYVSLAAADPVRAVRHETVHALRQSGLMTDAEFDILYRFAESAGLRQAYKIDANYGDLYRKAYADRGDVGVEALLREETIADLFADYSLNGRRFADEFGRAGRTVDKVLDAIVKFLKQVRDALHNQGFRDVRDIFEAIESGAMAGRAERVALPGGAEVEGFHLFALKAFHGTPHTFDPEPGAPAGRFRADRIGTGEGAQVFGHGLYFAESEGVARSYQNALPFRKLRDDFRQALPDDADFDEVMELIGTGHFTPYQDRVLRALSADDWLGFDYPSQAISAAYSGRIAEWDPSQELLDAIQATGRLYEVRIDAEPDQFLDWDKPLSQQSEAVKKSVLPVAMKEAERELQRRARNHARNDAQIREVFGKEPPPREPLPTAEELAMRLWGNELARGNEDALREAGLVGVRYLDQSSRSSGSGTSNFVVFPGNEHLVEIVAVDGKPVVNLAADLADVERTTDLQHLAEACKL